MNADEKLVSYHPPQTFKGAHYPYFSLNKLKPAFRELKIFSHGKLIFCFNCGDYQRFLFAIGKYRGIYLFDHGLIFIEVNTF